MAVEQIATAESAPDHFAPEEVALHARDVQFDFSNSSLAWIEGDPYGSHVISSLNLLLPTGERWFCKNFTEAMGYVKDERLREEMIGFMGQEAVHAKSHDKALPEFLLRHGIDTAPFIDQVEWFFGRISERLDTVYPAPSRGAAEVSVEIIAGLEHFFAALGNWVLNNKWDELGADPVIKDLFRWHGAEEVEHRHVAYNVAGYFSRGYLRHMVASVVATVLLVLLVARGTKFLVRNDPSLPNLGYLRLIWKARQAGKRGSIPSFRFLLVTTLRLFKPNYSPEAEGNTAQAIAYLATSPAAREIHG